MELETVFHFGCQRVRCTQEAQSDWTLPRAVVQAIEAPDVLLIGYMSGKVLKQQLDVATKLCGVRVRIATFNCNRSLVLSRGFKFYDIGSSMLLSVGRGSASTCRSASLRLSWAFFDDGHAQFRGPSARPFVADVAISHLPLRTLAHGEHESLLQAPIAISKPIPGSKENDLEANVEISSMIGRLDAEGRGSSCAVFTALTAHWLHARTNVKLSGAAAASLIASGVIRWSELELLRTTSKDIRGEEPCATYVVGSKLLVLSYTLRLLARQILDRLCLFVSQEQFAEENRRCLRMRNPLHRSRVKQAWFDLELINNQLDGDVEEHISRLWEERLCDYG